MVALFVRNGGSRHTGQAAPPQRNIHRANKPRPILLLFYDPMLESGCCRTCCKMVKKDTWETEHKSRVPEGKEDVIMKDDYIFKNGYIMGKEDAHVRVEMNRRSTEMYENIKKYQKKAERRDKILFFIKWFGLGIVLGIIITVLTSCGMAPM